MTNDIRGHLPRIEICVFDPKTASDQDWQAYHAYRRQRMHDDVPDEPIVSDDARRRDMTRDWPLTEPHIRLALIDGEIAGSAMFWTRHPGTEDYDKHARYIAGDMGVRKDRRRRGVGSALLRTFVTFARDRGYEIATCSTFLDDGAAFLDAVGAEVKQRTRQNRLQIGDIPAGLVNRWAKAYEAHNALRWEIHAPRVPFNRYGELIPQLNLLLNSQPLGTLDHPPLRIDLDQIRAWYANMDTHGGEHIMVLLMHDETVAAMSDVSWDPEFPERSSVGLTGVAPTWRGKGLAKAVKARQLQILTQRQPQVRQVITSNATVNAAMLAVNTQLGFKPHREIRTYQATITALEEWLAQRALFGL
jgi:GNAT superfamily N-acetyltransferase